MCFQIVCEMRQYSRKRKFDMKTNRTFVFIEHLYGKKCAVFGFSQSHNESNICK